MKNLSKKMIKIIAAVVVLAIVVGGAAYFLFGGDSTKKVTAQFSSAVGVYAGTPVKILGIDVGEVTKVKPNGATVSVSMEYDSKYKLPHDAISVIVANSLVSDRFIQLAPAYSGSGPQLANNAQLPESRTASPAELDDIYSALNKLSVSLGPKGANKKGSLSQLVNVGAANLQGNGAALGTSITKLSAAARTLALGRGDLFGTVKNLQVFTKALADSDGAVRHFNEQLAQVAGDLADERGDLGSALHNLGIALNDVAGFVKTNAAKTKTDITGLKTLTGTLVKEQAALNETLGVAPVALANIVHAYQPNIGALGTRGNLSSLLDPASLCAILDPSLIPGLPASVTSPLGSISGVLKSTCKAILGKVSITKLISDLGLPSNVSAANLGKAITGLVGGLASGTGGGGLGGIITGGG